MSTLKFSEAIAIYYHLFGYSNVKVLLFEELNHNPELFSKKISDFMGISKELIMYNLIKEPINTYNNSQSKFRRFRSKFFPNLVFSDYLPKPVVELSKKQLMNLLKKTKNNKSVIPDTYIEKLRDYYKYSNQKVIEMTGLDLEKYNYPL